MDGRRMSAPISGELRCTCPTGDGSLRWPCPTHPPTPAEPDQRDAELLLDAAAQLSAGLAQLSAALVELLQPAVEWLLRYIEACARLIERIGRRRGEISVPLVLDTSRFDAAMAEYAGRQQLGRAEIAGAFGVPLSVIEPAGDLATAELLPAGYAEGDLHPSHEWELCTAERAECLRCGLCTCCDAGPLVAGPCDTP
jgi:hypothetical protein